MGQHPVPHGASSPPPASSPAPHIWQQCTKPWGFAGLGLKLTSSHPTAWPGTSHITLPNISVISALLRKQQGLQEKREGICMYPWSTVWQAPTHLAEIRRRKCFAWWSTCWAFAHVSCCDESAHRPPQPQGHAPTLPCRLQLPEF